MIKFQVIKIISRYNISIDRITDLVPKLLTGEYFGEKQEGKILCYYYDTWGSCRLWKLVLLKKEAETSEANTNNTKDLYIKGEFIDDSSRKNAHQRAILESKDMPSEFVLYYREQPSCNQHRWFSFRALIRKIEVSEIPYAERLQS